MNKNIALAIIIIILALTTTIFGLKLFSQEDGWICQDGQWVKHGNPSAPALEGNCGPIAQIQPAEIVPAQDGQKDKEKPEIYLDGVKIFSPKSGEILASPLKISGEAPGYWFFEGDMPVKLLDSKGKTIGQHYLTAKGEWMTESLVPFEGKLEFSYPPGGKATLVISQDDPSGMAKVKEIKIPISLAPSKDHKVFSSNRIGLNFSYPASWSMVQEEERDYADEGKTNPATIVAKAEGTNLLWASNGEDMYYGRGGSTFDEAREIKSEDYLRSFCLNHKDDKTKKNCERQYNFSGIPYVKYKGPVCSEGGCEGNTIFYYLYNPTSKYRGIIFSTITFQKNENFPSAEEEKIFDAIVNSVSFN